MNRRNFIKSVASLAPLIFVPKLIKPTWKQTLKYGKVFKHEDYMGEWSWFIEDTQFGFLPKEARRSDLIVFKRNDYGLSKSDSID